MAISIGIYVKNVHNTQNMVIPWSYRCRILSPVCSCCFLLFPLKWALPGVALMFLRTLQKEEIFLHLHFIAFLLLEITFGTTGHNPMYPTDSSQFSKKGWTHPEWAAGTSQGWWIHHCDGKNQTRKKNKARIMLGLVNFWIPLPKEVPWHCSNSPGSSIALLRHRGFNPENVQVPITPKKGFSCYFMAGKTLFERIFLEI